MIKFKLSCMANLTDHVGENVHLGLTKLMVSSPFIFVSIHCEGSRIQRWNSAIVRWDRQSVQVTFYNTSELVYISLV